MLYSYCTYSGVFFTPWQLWMQFYVCAYCFWLCAFSDWGRVQIVFVSFLFMKYHLLVLLLNIKRERSKDNGLFVQCDVEWMPNSQQGLLMASTLMDVVWQTICVQMLTFSETVQIVTVLYLKDRKKSLLTSHFKAFPMQFICIQNDLHSIHAKFLFFLFWYIKLPLCVSSKIKIQRLKSWIGKNLWSQIL